VTATEVEVAGCGEIASRGRYVRGCRCTDCRTVARAYYRDYWFNSRKQYEGRPLVPFDDALKQHLDSLRQMGMGYRAIADAAGVGRKTVAELLRGERTKGVRAETHNALMAVQGSPSWAPAIGLTRRLRALSTLGWRQSDIATESGVAISVINELMAGNQKVCMRGHAADLRACYERLSMRVGPSAKTRGLALKKGWVSSLAWDDDAIDDPSAKPVGLKGRYLVGDYIDEAAVLRRMAGERLNLTKAERIEVVARLRAAQWSLSRIEEHTGLKTDRYIAREKAA
jgi:transcriptional regulator with XRE-family HTH domain